MKVVIIKKGVSGKFNTVTATISMIRTIMSQIIIKKKNNFILSHSFMNNASRVVIAKTNIVPPWNQKLIGSLYGHCIKFMVKSVITINIKAKRKPAIVYQSRAIFVIFLISVKFFNSSWISHPFKTDQRRIRLVWYLTFL